MSIKQRLTLLFGLIGVLPVLIAGIVLTNQGNSEIDTMGGSFGDSMRHQALEQLDTVRDSKTEVIENYFAGTESQLAAYAEDRTVMESLRVLTGAYDSYRDEKNVTPIAMRRM
jgi:hypothetical protein